MRRYIYIVVACLLIFAGCSITTRDTHKQTQEPMVVVASPVTQSTAHAPTQPPLQDPWTDEEVEAMARTLSGECCEDKPHDKRLVAEVILNRVADGCWGDTVTEVVTAKKQFHGYWNPSRDISENDIAIATEALHDWYESGQKALSEYLYFEAGPNRENVFRKEY